MNATHLFTTLCLVVGLAGCDTVREPESPTEAASVGQGGLSGKADERADVMNPKWDDTAPGSTDEGSEAIEDSVEPQPDASQPDDAVEEISPPTPSFPNIGGYYTASLLSEVVTRSEGQETLNQTQLGGFAHLQQEGDELAIEIYLCDLSLPEVQGYQPEVDVEVLRAQPPMQASGFLYEDDEVLRLQTTPSAWTLGVVLDDPVADSLPLDALDPRVEDVDGDGYPGMTLLLGGWSVYGALRLTFELMGQLEPGGLIEGESELGFDTVILGDNIPFVSVAAQVESASASSTVVSQSHRFSLTPYDGDSPTCGDISLEPNF